MELYTMGINASTTVELIIFVLFYDYYFFYLVNMTS